MKHILLILTVVLVAYRAQTAPAPAAAQDQPGRFSGKVTETTNAAGYTYVQVDTGTNKVWVAAPKFDVKVGDKVAVGGAMAMPNYHSKTLNRNFDVVYFTDHVNVNGGQSGAAGTAGLPPNHPPINSSSSTLPPNHPPVAGATAAPADFSGLKKPAGGKTVAEIIENKAKLNGQEVKVRGKVVKYNEGIMGKNWLHIQDGTGRPGSNDLLVTTDTKAKPGDTVLVTGKVATNKDFGFNYKYAVMVEDAKIVVE